MYAVKIREIDGSYTLLDYYTTFEEAEYNRDLFCYDNGYPLRDVFVEKV